MKKLIAVAAAVVCTGVFADIKIGTVDMMVLVRNHKSYDSNKKLLQETEKDAQREIDRMKADLEALQEDGKKIADQARNPMLSQAAKEKIEKELLDIQNKFIDGQQRLRSQAMDSQRELQDLETKLLKITTEDIRAVVNKFAEKNGYDIIVESTVTAFAKKELNVTDGLLLEMGVDPKTAKGRENANEGK